MFSWFGKKKKNGADPGQPQEVDTAGATAGSEAPPTGADSSGEESEKGLFARLRERLSKTRSQLAARVDSLFLGRKEIDEELFEELEEILVTADLGVETTMELLDRAREQVARRSLSDPMALREVLKRLMVEMFDLPDHRPPELEDGSPMVIMVLGVNGVGKTTTIGKLAHKFKQAGRKVLLIAGDTFRAAAAEQLKEWGHRSGVEVVAQHQGADPSSVVFDGLDFARARGYDLVLVDTAGRLHTKVNLMEELKKIKRVMEKKVPGAPHEILLVIDATTGQNGVSQARLFKEAVDVTSIALTKLDGTAKGGIALQIANRFKIPIRFIGIGEQMDDLREFDPGEFVDALFDRNGSSGATA